jgi:catechol 2,3-dioxygenase-like lactoylglutathione lyase family enzyme
MRIPGIDHIGMASADLGRHIEIFGDKLGLEIHDIHEKDPYGGLRAAFARVSDTDFELLEEARGGAVSSPDRAGCAGRC